MRATLIIIMGLLLGGCTHLFFHPVQKHLTEPQALGLDVRDVWFETADGLRLHGWFVPAKRTARGTVLYLHGNAENISTHIGSVYLLPDFGFNVFLFDYRGYGRSEGEPSVEGLVLDFEAALSQALADKRISGSSLFVFGQSLGGAVAVCGLALSGQRSKVDGLVLDSTFTGFREIAREKLAAFWLTWALQWPLAMTVPDTCRPRDAIAQISPVPVLIVHSRDDKVIPFHHGEELFNAAQSPKEFWPTRYHSHNRIFSDPRNQEALARYLLQLVNTVSPPDQ